VSRFREMLLSGLRGRVSRLHAEKLCEAREDAPRETFERKCEIMYCWELVRGYGGMTGFTTLTVVTYCHYT
jgi:hypothetical protein